MTQKTTSGTTNEQPTAEVPLSYTNGECDVSLSQQMTLSIYARGADDAGRVVAEQVKEAVAQAAAKGAKAVRITWAAPKIEVV